MSSRLNLVNIIGSPSVGKSTLAANIYAYTGSRGLKSHLITEFIKDWAIRKIPITPLSQLAVLGNQSHYITALLNSKYELAISDTCLLLSAFYANYYSDNSFPHLITATKEWEEYLIEHYSVEITNFFIYLTESEYRNRYKPDGRYETIEQCLSMQDKMREWFDRYEQITVIQSEECHPEHILKLAKVEL